MESTGQHNKVEVQERSLLESEFRQLCLGL